LTIDQREYALRLPRREIVTMALYRIGVPLLVLGYVFALGAAQVRPVVFAVLAALTVLGLVLTVLRIRLALSAPHAVLTTAGVEIATPPLGGRKTIPWNQVHLMWIDVHLGNRNLAVLLRGAGTDKVRYLALPADPVATDGLDVAVRALSGGEVSLADHGPEDDGLGLPRGVRMGPQRRRRPPVRTVPVARLIGALPVLLVLIPLVLALPVPWNQPWWPGDHRARQAPDPCAALDADLTAALVGDSAQRRTTYDAGGVRECTSEGNGATLVVRYSVHTALFSSSVRKADDYFHRSVPDGPIDRLDLGDVGWMTGKAPDSTAIYLGPSQLLRCRSGNVVVEVAYTGGSDPTAVQPAVLAIGTRAVNAIRFT